MNSKKPRIAVIGGTGDLGGGLVRRWARAGYSVIIGSRTQEKAERVAEEVREELGGGEIAGLANPDAAEAADLVVLTVPFSSQAVNLEAIREQLQGKILVDATVPLVPPKVSRVQLPPEGSAALAAKAAVGDGVTVVSAFQNVGAAHLRDDHPIATDVLVSGETPEAREEVIRLVEAAGMKGWHAGPLSNAVAAEALTSILIGINRHYKIAGAGLKITGDSNLD